MRGRYLLALSLWLVPLGAGAGTVTINFGGTPVVLSTNASQDADLGDLLADENAARAARTPPDTALSMEQYLGQIIAATVQGYTGQATSNNLRKLCTRWPSLTGAQKTQVRTLFNLTTNPCN